MDAPRAVPAGEGLSSVITSNAQQGPNASTIKMAAEAVSPAVRKPWGKKAGYLLMDGRIRARARRKVVLWGTHSPYSVNLFWMNNKRDRGSPKVSELFCPPCLTWPLLPWAPLVLYTNATPFLPQSSEMSGPQPLHQLPPILSTYLLRPGGPLPGLQPQGPLYLQGGLFLSIRLCAA